MCKKKIIVSVRLICNKNLYPKGLVPIKIFFLIMAEKELKRFTFFCPRLISLPHFKTLGHLQNPSLSKADKNDHLHCMYTIYFKLEKTPHFLTHFNTI